MSGSRDLATRLVAAADLVLIDHVRERVSAGAAARVAVEAVLRVLAAEATTMHPELRLHWYQRRALREMADSIRSETKGEQA